MEPVKCRFCQLPFKRTEFKDHAVCAPYAAHRRRWAGAPTARCTDLTGASHSCHRVRHLALPCSRLLSQAYCGSRTAECEGCQKQVVLARMEEHTALECEVLCAHLPHVQARIASEAAKKEADALAAQQRGSRRGVGGRIGSARLAAGLGAAVIGGSDAAAAAAASRRLGDMLETAQLQSALLESALDAKRLERKATREIDQEDRALGACACVCA